MSVSLNLSCSRLAYYEFNEVIDSLPNTIGNYQLKMPLGGGAQGFVGLYLDRHSNKDVAIKITQVQDEEDEDNDDNDLLLDAENEVEMLEKVKHIPCAQQFIETFPVTSEQMAIVTEYAGDRLLDVVQSQKLPVSVIKDITRQFLLLAKALEKEGIVHGDALISNTCLLEGKIRVIDWANGFNSTRTSENLYNIAGAFFEMFTRTFPSNDSECFFMEWTSEQYPNLADGELECLNDLFWEMRACEGTPDEALNHLDLLRT